MVTDDRRPLTIRCDALILAKCKEIAKQNRRSMNAQIEEYLAIGVADFERLNGPLDVDIPEE